MNTRHKKVNTSWPGPCWASPVRPERLSPSNAECPDTQAAAGTSRVVESAPMRWTPRGAGGVRRLGRGPGRGPAQDGRTEAGQDLTVEPVHARAEDGHELTRRHPAGVPGEVRLEPQKIRRVPRHLNGERAHEARPRPRRARRPLGTVQAGEHVRARRGEHVLRWGTERSAVRAPRRRTIARGACPGRGSGRTPRWNAARGGAAPTRCPLCSACLAVAGPGRRRPAREPPCGSRGCGVRDVGARRSALPLASSVGLVVAVGRPRFELATAQIDAQLLGRSGRRLVVPEQQTASVGLKTRGVAEPEADHAGAGRPGGYGTPITSPYGSGDARPGAGA